MSRYLRHFKQSETNPINKAAGELRLTDGSRVLLALTHESNQGIMLRLEGEASRNLDTEDVNRLIDVLRANLLRIVRPQG